MTTNMRIRSGTTPPSTREVEIELLALDLTTCTRCVGTLANIERAIDSLQQVLPVTGTKVRVQTIRIASEDEARQHTFVTSPTIRVNGRDITFETLESRCDSCSELCGCDDGTTCRVWRYEGQEYTEAPVGLIVDAILHEIYGGGHSRSAEPAPFHGVPENLQCFFASRSADQVAVASACCPPSEQSSCCAPSEKDACCGASQSTGCGCQ
jgi:hypothetical protein